MKTTDKGRKYMWLLLGALLAFQTYFFQELFAALALFALGFAAIAAVVGGLYLLHSVWALGVNRVAESRHPVMVVARQGVNAVENLARRPLRRPGSAEAR